MRLAIICGMALAISTVMTSDLQAQSGGRSGRYQPATPTTSPYLNLLRRDSGRLPNYYSLVRPQQRQESDSRQQQQQLNRQAARVSGLSDQFLEAEQGSIRPTGSASLFMNYSHFYRAPSQGSGRRR